MGKQVKIEGSSPCSTCGNATLSSFDSIDCYYENCLITLTKYPDLIKDCKDWEEEVNHRYQQYELARNILSIKKQVLCHLCPLNIKPVKRTFESNHNILLVEKNNSQNHDVNNSNKDLTQIVSKTVAICIIITGTLYVSVAPIYLSILGAGLIVIGILTLFDTGLLLIKRSMYSFGEIFRTLGPKKKRSYKLWN